MKNLAFTIWLTGLSASGKSTLAETLKEKMQPLTTFPVEILDGEEMRRTINKDLGRSPEERNIAAERTAIHARKKNLEGTICIVATISHDDKKRRQIRQMLENFVLVFLDTPLDICAARDHKGHYEKAFRGELDYFIGVTAPYEVPLDAEVVVNTVMLNPEQEADLIIAFLSNTNLLSPSLES